MALTACFGSPLFTLLGGLTCTLFFVYSGLPDDDSGGNGGAIARSAWFWATEGGSRTTPMPQGTSIRVLYICSLACSVVWAVAVPLVWKYKLTRTTAALGFVLYGAVVIAYMLTVL